jgi:hypothetical protein
VIGDQTSHIEEASNLAGSNESEQQMKGITMAMTTFPEKYKLVNKYVQELRLYYELPSDRQPQEDVMAPNQMTPAIIPEDRSYDYFVTLKDGRCFGFSAYTPEFFRDYMEREHDISFVDSGIVIVRSVTVDSILDSLEKCLYLAKDYGIEHFGYACKS